MNSEQVYDSLTQNVVCIRNLCVRKFDFLNNGVVETRNSSAYESVILLTRGSIRASILTEDVFTEFSAPHMVVLEKDTEYIFHSLEDGTELYEISALRHETGDIVNPDNLVRQNYPFDTTRSFEEQ